MSFDVNCYTLALRQARFSTKRNVKYFDHRRRCSYAERCHCRARYQGLLHATHRAHPAGVVRSHTNDATLRTQATCLLTRTVQQRRRERRLASSCRLIAGGRSIRPRAKALILSMRILFFGFEGGARSGLPQRYPVLGVRQRHFELKILYHARV